MSRERFKCFVQLRDFATGLAGPLMAWWSPPAIDQLVQSKLVLSQQCHSGRCLGLPTTGPCFQQGWALRRALLWFFNQAFLFDLSPCTISIPLLVTHDAPGYGTVLSCTGVEIFKCYQMLQRWHHSKQISAPSHVDWPSCGLLGSGRGNASPRDSTQLQSSRSSMCDEQ